MDQAKENPKVLLLHKAGSELEIEPWLRLAKAFKGIAELEIQAREEPPAFSEISELSKERAQVFLDISLADFSGFAESKVPNLTLVKPDSFAWNAPAVRKLMLPILSHHSLLLLEDTPPKDLVRLLHLYLTPKRLGGVTPLLEKGSVVLGEKIQALDTLGSTIDKLGVFISKIETFELTDRITDLRQVLSGVITKAFLHAGEANPAHPTVDFQVGINQSKMVINLRFQRGKLDPAGFPLKAIDGRDLFWQQIWLCSDQLLVTHHTQYDEIELMLVISRRERQPFPNFRTFLAKISDRSQKKDNLLIAPQSFDFQILSNVRLRDQETVSLEVNQSSSDIDFGSLPETVVKKIQKLSEESNFQKEQLEKVAAALRESQIKSAQIAKDLSQKKGEAVRLSKTVEAQQETFRIKMAELEKQIEHLKSVRSQQAPVADTAVTNSLQEAIAKLEGSLRAAENEKNQQAERMSNEQKKVAALELKYTTLYKDLAGKDKEIGELKTVLIKIRKEGTAGTSGAAGNAVKDAAAEANVIKLRETETRETALKQELRKVMFKLENQDKNVKAIQADAAEKAKLWEQKLQGAKAKELELLKKIDELANALKKASKAA